MIKGDFTYGLYVLLLDTEQSKSKYSMTYIDTFTPVPGLFRVILLHSLSIEQNISLLHHG